MIAETKVKSACHAHDGARSDVLSCVHACSVRRSISVGCSLVGRALSGARHGLKYGQFLMAMLADPDFSNTTIRRFEVMRLIARGGMGEVYLARDAVLGRDLALKILRQDVTWDANRLDRFVQEARAASALNHPHLIAIYDIGESAPKRNGVALGSPVLYIAMELVSGETLRKAIEAKRLDLKRALEYLIQVVDALGAAHAAGVIHRDLKPENLMIADGGYAKVLDFGVAKLRADIAPPKEDSDAVKPGGGHRHRGLHVARAGPGPAARSANGHLLVRLRAVRGHHRASRVPGDDLVRHAEADSE